MYCLADMAATSASEWVGGATGAAMRGFLTAGGSAVSEMKRVVPSQSVKGPFQSVLTFLLCRHRVVGHYFEILSKFPAEIKFDRMLVLIF